MSAIACFQGHGEPLSVPLLLRSGQLAYGLSAACCAPAKWLTGDGDVYLKQHNS